MTSVDTALTIVTPPTVYIPTDGLRVYLFGPGEWKADLLVALEQYAESSPTTPTVTVYHCSSTSEHYDWFSVMVGTVDLIVCSADSWRQLKPYHMAVLGNLLGDTPTIFSIPDAPEYLLKMMRTAQTGNHDNPITALINSLPE